MSDSLNEKVDCIILDNVLEHLMDPREMMQIISDTVKPGGMFIVIVPNLHDVRRYWQPDSFWTVWTHINYFNRRAFRRLLDEFGFDFFVYPPSTDAEPKGSVSKVYICREPSPERISAGAPNGKART